MSGLSDEAAITLESLLCLQLKLSYLSTKTPKVLKEYTHSKVRGFGDVSLLNQLDVIRVRSEISGTRGAETCSHCCFKPAFAMCSSKECKA